MPPYQPIPDLVIVVLLIVVHPHLRQPHVVPHEHVSHTVCRLPRVRAALTEYVTYVRAWDGLQGPSTHPYLVVIRMVLI